MKKSKKPFRPSNIRWFIFMNIAIAVLLTCSSAVLKKGTERYGYQAHIDAGYIFRSKGETDTNTLKNSLFYTEAARASTSRSLFYFSNGASLTGLIISIAFIANAAFIFRMNRNHKRLLAEAIAAPSVAPV